MPHKIQLWTWLLLLCALARLLIYLTQGSCNVSLTMFNSMNKRFFLIRGGEYATWVFVREWPEVLPPVNLIIPSLAVQFTGWLGLTLSHSAGEVNYNSSSNPKDGYLRRSIIGGNYRWLAAVALLTTCQFGGLFLRSPSDHPLSCLQMIVVDRRDEEILSTGQFFYIIFIIIVCRTSHKTGSGALRKKKWRRWLIYLGQ